MYFYEIVLIWANYDAMFSALMFLKICLIFNFNLGKKIK